MTIGAGMGGSYGGLARLPQGASIWTGVVCPLALPLRRRPERNSRPSPARAVMAFEVELAL